MAEDLAPLMEREGRPVFRATIDGFHRPRVERTARGAESPELARHLHQVRYGAGQALFMARDHPADRADVVVDNEDPELSRLLRRTALPR